MIYSGIVSNGHLTNCNLHTTTTFRMSISEVSLCINVYTVEHLDKFHSFLMGDVVERLHCTFIMFILSITIPMAISAIFFWQYTLYFVFLHWRMDIPYFIMQYGGCKHVRGNHASACVSNRIAGNQQ